mmetsp:Transcript_29205/g.33429  ORF Transcript_29205/g.33429 Transcript_29205/m.33429 type:complete len:233 (-) Transcript_29205:12-710(-)
MALRHVWMLGGMVHDQTVSVLQVVLGSTVAEPSRALNEGPLVRHVHDLRVELEVLDFLYLADSMAGFLELLGVADVVGDVVLVSFNLHDSHDVYLVFLLSRPDVQFDSFRFLLEGPFLTFHFIPVVNSFGSGLLEQFVMNFVILNFAQSGSIRKHGVNIVLVVIRLVNHGARLRLGLKQGSLLLNANLLRLGWCPDLLVVVMVTCVVHVNLDVLVCIAGSAAVGLAHFVSLK